MYPKTSKTFTFRGYDNPRATAEPLPIVPPGQFTVGQSYEAHKAQNMTEDVVNSTEQLIFIEDNGVVRWEFLAYFDPQEI